MSQRILIGLFLAMVATDAMMISTETSDLAAGTVPHENDRISESRQSVLLRELESAIQKDIELASCSTPGCFWFSGFGFGGFVPQNVEKFKFDHPDEYENRCGDGWATKKAVELGGSGGLVYEFLKRDEEKIRESISSDNIFRMVRRKSMSLWQSTSANVQPEDSSLQSRYNNDLKNILKANNFSPVSVNSAHRLTKDFDSIFDKTGGMIPEMKILDRSNVKINHDFMIDSDTKNNVPAAESLRVDISRDGTITYKRDIEQRTILGVLSTSNRVSKAFDVLIATNGRQFFFFTNSFQGPNMPLQVGSAVVYDDKKQFVSALKMVDGGRMDFTR